MHGGSTDTCVPYNLAATARLCHWWCCSCSANKIVNYCYTELPSSIKDICQINYCA